MGVEGYLIGFDLHFCYIIDVHFFISVGHILSLEKCLLKSFARFFNPDT